MEYSKWETFLYYLEERIHRLHTLYRFRWKKCPSCPHKLADHYKPSPFRNGTCQWRDCKCNIGPDAFKYL
jgi:hypothetical protein